MKIHKTFPHIKLNIYSNYEPDLDIYYLYKAKHLITGFRWIWRISTNYP